MYIAACEIARKKPIGFRPTGCSSVYIQLLTVYIIAPIHLRCNAFFLQLNSFFPFTFLHLSITLLYYSFTILYSPEQLHVCNLPDALVPYIRNSASRTAVFPAFRTSRITCPMYKSIPWRLDGFNKISCNSYGRIDVCACLW